VAFDVFVEGSLTDPEDAGPLAEPNGLPNAFADPLATGASADAEDAGASRDEDAGAGAATDGSELGVAAGTPSAPLFEIPSALRSGAVDAFVVDPIRSGQITNAPSTATTPIAKSAATMGIVVRFTRGKSLLFVNATIEGSTKNEGCLSESLPLADTAAWLYADFRSGTSGTVAAPVTEGGGIEGRTAADPTTEGTPAARDGCDRPVAGGVIPNASASPATNAMALSCRPSGETDVALTNH